MSDQIRGPTLYGLLNQFEDIGGPEIYGPEGLAILVSLWRRSNKLNWSDHFTMTNKDLHVQTGIKSRTSLSLYRSKLCDSGLILYDAPPLGKSRGDYVINFNLLVPLKPVHKMDNYSKAVQQPVQNLDDPLDTVLNLLNDVDVEGGTPPSIPQPVDTPEQKLRKLMRYYCDLHKKFEVDIAPKDIGFMQKVIALGVPLPLIASTMKDVFRKKNGDVSAFSYYEKPILSAWETHKSITAPNAGVVAIGDQDTDPKQKKGRLSKQEERNERAKQKIREAEDRERERGQEIVLHPDQQL